jgi:hypothetical protein
MIYLAQIVLHPAYRDSGSMYGRRSSRIGGNAQCGARSKGLRIMARFGLRRIGR